MDARTLNNQFDERKEDCLVQIFGLGRPQWPWIDIWTVKDRKRKNPKQSGIVAVDSCFAIFMARKKKRRDNCVRLRSLSVLGSFGVVLMSFEVNFHVVRRSALQNSMCVLKSFARFRQSIFFSSSIMKSKGGCDRRVRAAQPQQEFPGVLHPGCKSTKPKYP